MTPQQEKAEIQLELWLMDELRKTQPPNETKYTGATFAECELMCLQLKYNELVAISRMLVVNSGHGVDDQDPYCLEATAYRRLRKLLGVS